MKKLGIEGGKAVWVDWISSICKGPEAERLWRKQKKASMLGSLLISKLLPSLFLDQRIFIVLLSIQNNELKSPVGCLEAS